MILPSCSRGSQAKDSCLWRDPLLSNLKPDARKEEQKWKVGLTYNREFDTERLK